MFHTCLLLVSYLLLGTDAKELTPFRRFGRGQPPTITNSLVNLGKIDIAFFLTPGHKDLIGSNPFHRSSLADFLPSNNLYQPPTIDEPCPCSSLRHKSGLLPHPSELLNKILMSNELFSFREPSTSMSCCESHEQFEENSIVFDTENQNSVKKASPFQLPGLPFLKPKQVEIFLFPKRTDVINANKGPLFMPMTMTGTTKVSNKEKPKAQKPNIHVVGDIDLRQDFMNTKRHPFFLPREPNSPPVEYKALTETNKKVTSEADKVNTGTNSINGESAKL